MGAPNFKEPFFDKQKIIVMIVCISAFVIGVVFLIISWCIGK
jgi:hypothetical protein